MVQKPPTVRDVARRAGVSVATVSRVMNNKGYLSAEIKKQVQKAMDDLGYVPNQIARSFYKKRTNTIGVVIPTITHPFFGELVYHVEKYAEQQGLKVLICNSLNDPKIEKKYLQMLLENQVDGIIVGTHNDELDEYAIPNIPIIAVERFLADKRVSTICSDNFEGGRLATDYLLDRGRQNLVCFASPFKQHYPANDRRTAFVERMEDRGFEPRIVEVSNLDVTSACQIIRQTFEADKGIDGVFATDDIIASLVIRVLKKMSLQVNQDVDLVGFDGTEIIRQLLPELTTIKQPIAELAKYSVENLLSLIHKEKVPKMIVLPVDIVHGEG